MSRELHTLQEEAKLLRVTVQTIRNWISKGLITGYQLPASRALRVDHTEVMTMLRVVPATVARTPTKSLGPNARVVQVAQPIEVVE